MRRPGWVVVMVSGRCCGRFATAERDGVLFYNGRYNERHDFVALELVDGHVEFAFSLGTDVTRVAAFPPPGVQLSDGDWHQVTVSYLNRVSCCCCCCSWSTLCLKKVPTFKLSVTSSDLNRFSKYLHCWKAYEICNITHLTLGMLLIKMHYVGKLKIYIFCRYEHKRKQVAFFNRA